MTFAAGVTCNTAINNFLNNNYSIYVDPTSGTNLPAISIVPAIILTNFNGLGTDKTLDLLLWMFLYWKDVNLPDLMQTCGSAFNTSIDVNSNLLWKPDIFLANTAYGSASLTYSPTAQFGYLQNSSNVGMPIYNEIVSACTGMSLRNFPFDTQSCQMQFFAPNDPVQFLDGLSYNGAAGTNDDWTVLAFDIVVQNFTMPGTGGDTYPGFMVNVTASRETYYYVVNLVYPTACMAAMTALVFIMPCDEGEKSLLSATLVLALYVMMQTLSVILPDVSNSDFPVIVNCTNIVFIFSVVSLFEAVLIETVIIVAMNFNTSANKPMIDFFVLRWRKHKPHERKADAETPQRKSYSESTFSNSKSDLDKAEAGGNGARRGKMIALVKLLLHLHEKELQLQVESAEDAEQQELAHLAWLRFQYLVNFLTLIAYIIAVSIPFTQLNVLQYS